MINEQLNNLNKDVDNYKNQLKELEEKFKGVAVGIDDKEMRLDLFNMLDKAKKGETTPEEIINQFKQWQQ
jgi:hypothetical protein